MSKGYKKHQDRLDNVLSLGKDLARRSKSKCELCDADHKPLNPFEVEPIQDTPTVDHAVLICDHCRDQIESNKLDPQNWRFLESVIWSDIPAVQVVAVRVCKILAANGVNWAQDLLANIYLSPEVEEWLA